MHSILIALFAIICGVIPCAVMIAIFVLAGKTPGFCASNAEVDNFSAATITGSNERKGSEMPAERHDARHSCAGNTLDRIQSPRVGSVVVSKTGSEKDTVGGSSFGGPVNLPVIPQTPAPLSKVGRGASL